MKERAGELGLVVSLRTVQRIWRGEVRAVRAIEGGGGDVARRRRDRWGEFVEGPVISLGEEARDAVADILRRAARASYLELGEIELEARPGEISVRARVYEPEEEYE